MKTVVSGEKLYIKMEEAINLLCNTVKSTLGPKGSNIIINKSTFSPFITNDGVTIAECIESDDKIINTILEIAKEASIKTNETAGDGTTTTLVLLQTIFNIGLKLIKEGMNPIVVKKELDKSLNVIVEKIEKYSRKPNDSELKNIAIVSANDKEIGNIVSEVYLKIKNKNAITVKESNFSETKINYLNGYILNSYLASNYFLKDLKEIEYEESYILLFDNYLDDIEEIIDIINFIIMNNKKLVVLANDYSERLINEVVSLNIDNNINIILLKNPEYGKNQISILNDLSIITKAKIIEKLDYIDTSCLGIADKITIDEEKVTFQFKYNNDINKRVFELKKEIEKEENNNFVNERVAMFTSGLAEIVVGDKTTTERREKKMRYDDALCAVCVADQGVLPGSGSILFKISKELDNTTNGNIILKQALKAPFEQIMYNAGVEEKSILKIIRENDFNLIYNLNTLEYENINNTSILDATSVVINSLISSVSIASMLLTTTSIVINEYENNLNKVNDYNEL